MANQSKNKRSIRSRLNDASLKTGVVLLTGVGTAIPAFAEVDVTETVADLEAAETPIAAVAGASLGAYVGIRVWKLVRRAI